MIAELVSIHRVKHRIGPEQAHDPKDGSNGAMCLITAIARELSKIQRGKKKEYRLFVQARKLLEEAFRGIEAN